MTRFSNAASHRPFAPRMRLAGLCLVGILLVACAGCGEARGTVSGTVTFQKKPLPGGTVLFLSEDGNKHDQAQIQPDGTYTATNVPLGTVKVAVKPTPQGVKEMMKNKGKPPGTGEAGPKDVYDKSGKEYRPIPEHLQDPTKSNITTKVERGSQTYNIDLPDK